MYLLPSLLTDYFTLSCVTIIIHVRRVIKKINFIFKNNSISKL